MQKHFISIWFFIGSLLAIYGLLILGTGIYGLTTPPRVVVVLPQLHIDIWWGGGLLLLGLVYIICFRPKRGEN